MQLPFPPPYPIIRLLPKAEARAIRHGFPWVYAGELVMDRRTKALPPGSFAVLEDSARVPMGVVTINTISKINARMLDTDPTAHIDHAWITARLKAALAHREALYDAPFYRLVHAEADAMPGVVIDRFGDVAVLQPNAAWADAMAPIIAQVLQEIAGISTVIKNAGGRSRKLEGLGDENEVLTGTAPEGPIAVPMNGATYAADVMGGQKTGLFFDQRANQAFAAHLSKDRDILDVFSHVGGFGLAGLAAGARSALAIDSSAPALELAVQGAKMTGVEDKFEVMKSDAFAALEQLAEEGRKFGVVVCDPPAFAPSKRSLEAGLRAYERVARLAAGLVEDGGYLVLCSCSHAADATKFRNASARGIGRAGRRGQIIFTGFAGPDHPVMPQLAESGYLKSLVFRL